MKNKALRTIWPFKRGSRGQGLVEFALILPLLLLIVMALIDFGRALFIYANFFNSARDGGRVGAVNPLNLQAVHDRVRDGIYLVDRNEPDVWVWYDRGPDTEPFYNPAAVRVGDRVVIRVIYDLPMITPLIAVFTQSMRIDVQAARTIVTLGEAGLPGGPPPPIPPTPIASLPPTAVPPPTYTATPTPIGGPSPSPTPPPWYTATPRPTRTPTPTPIPIVHIHINQPLVEGDMVVAGIAQPGATLSLRDVHDPALQMSTVVQGDASFTFNLPTPLVAGHLIVVQGYGEQDFAVVQANATPSPTPSPTATPIGAYIIINPTCGPAGQVVSIAIEGYNWFPTNKKVDISWDGTVMRTNINPDTNGRFTTSISVTPAAGDHTITAVNSNRPPATASAIFRCPCAPTGPNLVISGMRGPTTAIPAGQSVSVDIGVRNIGNQGTTNFFWVDMFADPQNPGNLPGETSVAWGVISSLAASQTITLTLTYGGGFSTPGTHHIYAMADTWNQVVELSEVDNTHSITVTVAGEVTPTPTPTPIAGTGSISGLTYIFINNTVLRQSRVQVSAYHPTLGLVAETFSGDDGSFSLMNLPPGTYDVVGELLVNNQLYFDVATVQVVADQHVVGVVLVLH